MERHAGGLGRSGCGRTVAVLSAVALLLGACSSDDDKSDSTATTTPPTPGGVEVLPGGGAGSVMSGMAMMGMAATGGGMQVGITVLGVGSTEVDADIAHVVLIPRGSDDVPFDSPGRRRRPFDRKQVNDALAELGFDSDVISISEPGGLFDYGSTGEVVVAISAGELPERANEIRTAVRAVADLSDSGVRLKVSDCAEPRAEAQREAVAAAREAADGMAAAAGVEVGPLRHVSESFGAATMGTPSDPCNLNLAGDSDEFAFFSSSTLRDFETDLTVRVQNSVTAVFDVAGVDLPDRWITSTGSGLARGDADEAYVEVHIGEGDGMMSLFGDTSSRSGPSTDLDEVAAALADLDVNADDIAVTDGDPDSYPYLTQRIVVRVDIEQLPTIGDEILDRLEEELELSGPSGVRFGSSGCDSLVAQARDAAFQDADEKLASLADASGVATGDIVGLGTDLAGTPLNDPCSDPSDPGNASSNEEFYFGLLGSMSGGDLLPFDAPPRFEVSVSLTLTRALS